MITLGVDSTCWHVRLRAGEIALDDVVQTTAALGGAFCQVDLQWTADWTSARTANFASLVRSHDLGLFTVGGPIGAGSADVSVADCAERLRRWLRQTADLGGDSVMVWSGCARSAMLREHRFEFEREHLREVLAAAARDGAELGVRILFENVADFYADELAELVSSVDDRQVGVFLDLTNSYLLFENPIAAIATLAPHADAGHAKDFVIYDIWPERVETGGVSDDPRRGWQYLYCYPGEGAMDSPAAIDALHAAVGDREFRLAIEGLDSRLGVDDQPRRLTASLAYLRGLVEAAEANRRA